MSLFSIVTFIAGLVLLVIGAELLVRGASRLAAFFGISPLVIGLTIVAFGTSSPELAVSVQSGLSGQADIAVGNVVGSNIFNILFILGLSAAITPLIVSRQLIRLDVPVMIGVSILLLLFGLNQKISRLEGMILFTGVLGYTIFLIYQSRKEQRANTDDFAKEYGNGKPKSPIMWLLNPMLILSGLALLVLGSKWLVDGSIVLARMMGVSELVIGLTIVAAGTSLPEVATSVVASVRGERDIAVGNVVGSNIFNILAVLGLASAVTRGGISISTNVLWLDLPVMLGVAIICLPIFFTGGVISRAEGFFFLGTYIIYAIHLTLAATSHEMLPGFRTIVVSLVLPLAGLLLIVSTVRAFRHSGKYS